MNVPREKDWRMTISPRVQARSLPALLYLLGIGLENEKVPDRKKLGYVMRAAALIDLVLGAKLADVGGRARVTSEHGTGDAVLDNVLDEIASHRGRKWIGRRRPAQPTRASPTSSAGHTRIASPR